MATAILESLPSSLTSAVESVNSALPVSDELNEYLNEGHLPSASLQLSFLPGTRTLSKFLPEHECTLHVVDEVLFASLYWLACYFGLHLLFNRLQHYISHQEGAGKQRIGPFPLERARSLADRAKNFLFLVAIIYFGFAGHSRAFARPHPAKFCNDEAIWNCSELDASTTDELAASLGVRYPSPARARSRLPNTYQLSTPLAQRSPNVRRQKQLNLDVTPSLLRGASPAKSMFFDPDPEQGGADSPWRIKVTVQAEPRDGTSPGKSPAPQTRVTRVPLKDADGSSPAKAKKGTKRKSDADSAIKKRKGTPMRRRSGRTSGASRKSMEVEEATPAPAEQPAKTRRGRPRKSAAPEELIDKVAKEKEASPVVEIPSQANEAEELVEDVMEHQEDMNDFLAGGDDNDDEIDFVHLSQEQDSDDSGGAFDQRPQSEAPSTGATPGPPPAALRPVSGAFDFSKLTPLHVRHSLPAPKEQTPQRRDPRGPYKVTELYNDNFKNRFAYSPLPPRSSPAKSPAPFSKRESSPATEEDADMWRSMLDKPGRQSHIHGGQARESSADEDESEAESEENMPEATSRTIGEATMMQSEDFSMVSLSSLPSAKDINSSLLGQSQIDQSHMDRSVASSRRPSKLQKAVTFSSPLTQSFHLQHEDEPFVDDYDNGHGEVEEVDEDPLPRQRTPQKSSATTSAVKPFNYKDFDSPQQILTTPQHVRGGKKHLNARVSYPYNPHRQQQTPDNPESEARLPTPNSGENQTSPPPLTDKMQSDISYPDVEDEPIYPNVQDTPARSEAEMSTPPATPERDDSPRTKRIRETSLLSSGSKRSWVEEPKSARMVALENKWQEDRDEVMRTLAQARSPPVVIESDRESEDEDEEEEDELQSDPIPPAHDQTEEDVWQDISASYEDGPSLPPRRQRPTHTRPLQVERPSKAARTEQRRSPGAIVHVQQGEQNEATPRKSFDAEQNMASVQRRAKSKADVAALFGQLRGGHIPAPSFAAPKANSPAKPSPLRNMFIDGTIDETDISAMSDVRQLRNEMRNAQRRPPFAIGRGTTTTVPTKLKSIDDTMTTQDQDEIEAELAGDQSIISFTGQQRPSRPLFSGPSLREKSVKVDDQPATVVPALANKQDAADSSDGGIFSYIWRTLTFSHPYIPPPRPSHPTLTDASKYPLLPNTWAWSHTHWQTLDNLYQYYKRKPSRFSPTRTARPDNSHLMTRHWSRCVDITFSHWGYRVRLESTHITLAILFHSLLVLPSPAEYAKVYNKPLEYRHQDLNERRGQRISEWDVLVHLFAIVAGEMLREDEREGRRVRREEVEFRYRLKGEGIWRHVGEGLRI